MKSVRFDKLATLILLACPLLAAPGGKPAAATAPSTGKTGKLAFPTLRPETVTALTVIHGRDTARLVKADGLWLTSRDRYPADSAKVAGMLQSLAALETLPVAKPAKGTPTPDYELGPELAKRVEWKEPSRKPAGILIGRLQEKSIPEDTVDPRHAHDPAHLEKQRAEPPILDTTYWSRLDRARVFRTPGNPGSVPVREEDWKDRNIFPFFVYEDVQSVDVTWRDAAGKSHHYLLNRKDDTSAVLARPVASPVPRHNAARIFTQTPQFTVDEFVAPGDSLAGIALRKPALTLRVTMMDGRQHVLEAGDAAGDFQYAKHPRYGIPVKIARWRLDFFKVTVPDLLKPPPPPPEE